MLCWNSLVTLLHLLNCFIPISSTRAAFPLQVFRVYLGRRLLSLSAYEWSLMRRAVNKQKRKIHSSHVLRRTPKHTYEGTNTHAQWYYIITLLNMFSSGKHTEGGAGDSWCCFMQLLGPYFLFYLAEVKYVGTEKTKVCFEVTVRLK